MRLAALAALLTLAAGCGGASNPTPTVQLKLNGHMARAAPGAQTTPLRLAMAWYPQYGGTSPAAPVSAVVPQTGVTFTGDFPIAFSFHVDGPPPAKALSDLAVNGGTGHIAFGVLIAYEDGNGNGTFDTIPPGGAPIDHIVGVSFPDPSLPPPLHSHFVVYLAGTPSAYDSWAAFPLQQGYNLLRINSNFGVMPIPLDSDVTIPITSTPALDLFACPDIFASASLVKACGIDPYGGTYQAQGSIFATPTGTRLDMQVFDGNGAVTNASLAMDGAPVDYVAAGERYDWSSTSQLSGAHTLTISVPGHATETLPFVIPEPFTVVAPTPNQTLARGAAVPISWTAAAGTAYYDIYFLADDANGSWLFHDLPPGTSVTTPSISYSGPASVGVKAIGALGVGSLGSFLTPISQTTVPVTFAP